MAAMHIFCFLLLLNYVVSAPNTDDEQDKIIVDKVISNLKILESVLSSANTTLISMESIQSNLIVTTNEIFKQNQEDINSKIVALKQNVTKLRAKRSKSIIDECIDDEQPLDILVESISGEVRKCITVALAENVNIISSSIVEAQTFMDLPQKIAADLQTCSSARDCMLKISIDAVNESMEIPSKVLILSARIQQLAYHSLSNINGCALNGLLNVVAEGISIVEDIAACIAENS